MNRFLKFFKKIFPDKKIIFIVEDNEVYAKSLQAFIQTRFSNIKEIKIFNIGETCLAEMDHNPDIVIVDYFLNSKFEVAYNGLEVINRIKAMKPLTNIIVLSAQEKFDVILEAIKEYDCVYVQKDNDAFNSVGRFIKQIIDRKTSKTFN